MNIFKLLTKLKGKSEARLINFASEETEVYYINGADTLPPPLTREEEENAINTITEDESSKELLIKHNLRLVVYISKKFDNAGVGIEDLISIGTIGLIKAVNSYKPEKNIKLATYASRCIENEILMYMRKNASHRGDLSIDEPLNTDWDGNELVLSDVLGTEENSVGENIERNEDERCVREAVKRLDPREREIIELRYGLDGRRELTQKEVADRLGISQSYISRLEKKIICRLKKQIGGKV